jgi:hypothetical protein
MFDDVSQNVFEKDKGYNERNVISKSNISVGAHNCITTAFYHYSSQFLRPALSRGMTN